MTIVKYSTSNLELLEESPEWTIKESSEEKSSSSKDSDEEDKEEKDGD